MKIERVAVTFFCVIFVSALIFSQVDNFKEWLRIRNLILETKKNIRRRKRIYKTKINASRSCQI